MMRKECDNYGKTKDAEWRSNRFPKNKIQIFRKLAQNQSG